MLSSMNESAEVILSIAIILFSGFLLTRFTKRLKLPNVTGYIFAGIVIGPYVLNIIPESLIRHMDFVTDIALAFIAFGTGKYFKLSSIRKSGKKIILLTLFESLAAAIAVAVTMVAVFQLPVSFAILLGAIGCATAPASTIMTIRQYHAKGEFVNCVLEVVALDDAVALIAFSICTAIVHVLSFGGTLDYMTFITPLLLNGGAILCGAVCGFFLKFIINPKRSQEHKLVVAVAIILCITGFCTEFDISPLLSCMVMGAVYINAGGNKALFKQVNKFTPPILTMFFVISGLRLNVPAILTAGIVGVIYFIIRIVGKYAGAYIGASVCRYPPEIKKYLGLALIPQAGVSIGLAALGERMLPPDMGVLLSTIILSSAVLYEMVGPISAKRALILSGAIAPENLDISVPCPEKTSEN